MGEKKQHAIDRAPTARATCKGCGGAIAKGELRFGLVDFGFSDSGSYKYFHAACGQTRNPREYADALTRSELPKTELQGGAAQPAAATTTVAKSELPKWLTDAPSADTQAFAEGLAPPVTKDGAALDAASAAKLVAALHASTVAKPKKGVLPLESFEEWLGVEALRDFVWRLFVGWDNSDGHMRHKWLFEVLTRYADDAMAFRFRDLIAQWVKSNKKNAVEAGLEVLAESGTPTSLMIVSDLAQRFTYKGGYNKAAQTLYEVANGRGLTVAELEDRLVPTLGLEPNGSRTFDFGPRKFLLRIGPELEVELTSGTDRLKSWPAKKAGDDEQKVKEARAAFELLQNELSKAFKVHVTRLELAMSTGRRWASADWRKYLLEQPVMKTLVRRLVWGTYPGGVLGSCFSVDEQDQPMGLDLAPFVIPPDAKIGLVHPMELDATTRNAWANVLSDFEIIQPFAQLGRPLHEPRETTGTTLAPLTPTKIPIGPLHGVLNRLGYFKGNADDTLRTGYFGKRFGPLEVHINLRPGVDVRGFDKDDQTVTGAVVVDTKVFKALPIASIPKVIASEALHDMEVLAAAAKP